VTMATISPELAAYVDQLMEAELARKAAAATVEALPTRLPAGPLMRLVEGRGGLYACLCRHRRNGGLERAYSVAARQGRRTWKAADRLAIELLGLHPLEVWGSAWLEEELPA